MLGSERCFTNQSDPASHISRKETLRHDFLFPSDVFCPCIYYMTMKSAQINRYGGSEVIEINQNTPDTEQFFIKETIVQRLKTVAAFLAVAIPIVISIIRLLAGGG